MSLSITSASPVYATPIRFSAPKAAAQEAPVVPVAAQPNNVVTFAATQNPAIIATQAAAARFGLGI